MKALNIILRGILLLFILNNTHFAQAQETEEKPGEELATFYFKSAAIFKCNVKLPENYNPDRAYTLVIGLHGGGASPDSFIKIWDDVKGVNFIYATPQGPYSIVFDKLGNEWSLWSSTDLKVREQAAALISDYITDLTKKLKEQYKINDIYLFGFSQGAIFTYVAGLQNYQLYKGIIVFSGAGISEPLGAEQFAPNWLEDKYLEPAKSLRVFISHGTQDQAAKYELGLKSNEVLTGYGYDVSFNSFEGEHTIDPENLVRALAWINNK